MNKTLALWLCGSLLVIASQLFAATQKVGNYTWTYQVKGDGAEIYGHYVSGDGWNPSASPKPTGTITIPPSLGGLPVTSIGELAFLSCYDLTAVIIPETVTNIGRSAFNGCSGLSNLSIPAAVANIDDGAFCFCSGLLSISVDSENANYKSINGLLLTKDGKHLLQGVNGGDMKIPDGVTDIRSDAFYGCEGLMSVTLPDSVITLGGSAFCDCTGLTNVTIGVGVSEIGDCLFARCCSLTNIEIPDGVSAVGDSIFEGCSSLTNVVIGLYLTSISYGMFRDCQALTNVVIPENVTSIQGCAFYGCNSLAELILPRHVASIGDYAFYGCSDLTNVTIPDSVTSIGQNAFYGCNDSLFDTSTISGIQLLDGWVIGNTGALYGAVDLSGTRGVCDRAFYGCNELTSIILPSSIACIGHRMFYNCTALVSVTLPDSVTSIKYYAFENCIKLKSIVIPESVGEIESRAFSGCTGLKNVDIRGNGELHIESWTFEGCKGLENVILGDGVSVIDSYAFEGSCNLATVIIGDGVKSIDSYAFRNCSILSSVTIGKGVTCIDSYAFYNCSSLTRVTIPALTTSIGLWAFENCTNLSVVTLPKGLEIKNRFPSTTTFCRYTPIQTVTLDANGGTCTTESINVIFGNAYGDLPVPTREGCSFNGWTLDDMPIYTNTVVSALDDHTLVAHWKCTVFFDANGGACKTDSKSVQYGASIGSLPIPTRQEAAFVGWFTEAEGGEKVDQTQNITHGTTLYAHWLFEVANPVITSSTGAEFRMDCVVTITSATEGAKIYYTTDGSTPKKNADYIYSGPITITDTTTFKAVAVFNGISSGYVTITIKKRPLTLEEVLDIETDESVTLTTSKANPWTPILDSSANVGDSSARSGVIGNGTNTWICASVSGAGTMSFWYKSSCEHDEDNAYTWDRMMVLTNNVEIVDWRIDGETDWTKRTLSFVSGENTVKWVYYKDKSYTGGNDCVWLDGVTWTSDPIPDIGENPTAQQIKAALEGSKDAKLMANVTDATTYGKYREWASKVKAKDGSSAVGAKAVKSAPNAWLSFALGSETLIESAPTNGTLRIDDFRPTAESGKFDFTVSVKDIDIGSDAATENLKKVFGIEGGTILGQDGLSSDNVDITFGTPENGKVKFTAGPKNPNAGTFFMKVKMAQ